MLSNWQADRLIPLACGWTLAVVLYMNIDLKLRINHMDQCNYKIGDTCVYNGHVF